MSRRRLALVLVAAAFLLDLGPPAGAAGQRIQPSDLVYQGAFRLPDVPPAQYEIGWAWGGHAMAYYPGGDPAGPADGYPGSLFGTGHDANQYVAEITIPVPVISPTKNVSDLNTATFLQDFHDIRGGLIPFDTLEIPKAGLEYLPRQGAQTTDKLYFCWGNHLEYGNTRATHGWCELDLSDPRPAGVWLIGEFETNRTNDYIFEIPAEWAAAHTLGYRLATGRFRDGGQGSRGPCILAFGPWNDGNPPANGTRLGASPLLMYTDVEAGDDHTMVNYAHSDEWSGGAWLTAGARSAVIFVGTKGIGTTWYGYQDGTVWPEEPPYPPEPPGERGWWSTRFEGQILFYDTDDLAAVARGDTEPYEPQPYAVMPIDSYLYAVASTQMWHHTQAASFDRQRGLVYVFEPLVDDDKPIVHVWRIAIDQPPTVHVDDSNGTGVEDGTPEHPFDTIREGIAAAADGGTVKVARGTYRESLLIEAKRITIRGGYPGGSYPGTGNFEDASRDPNPATNATIINGGGASLLVTCQGAGSGGSVLSGFTLRNGGAGFRGGVILQRVIADAD